MSVGHGGSGRLGRDGCVLPAPGFCRCRALLPVCAAVTLRLCLYRPGQHHVQTPATVAPHLAYAAGPVCLTLRWPAHFTPMQAPAPACATLSALLYCPVPHSMLPPSNPPACRLKPRPPHLVHTQHPLPPPCVQAPATAAPPSLCCCSRTLRWWCCSCSSPCWRRARRAQVGGGGECEA